MSMLISMLMTVTIVTGDRGADGDLNCDNNWSSERPQQTK